MRHNPMLIGSCPRDRQKRKSAEVVAVCRAKGRYRLRLLTYGQSVPSDAEGFMILMIPEREKGRAFSPMRGGGVALLDKFYNLDEV
jgi:hypothetical protein